MKILTAEECPQLSPAWWEARVGRPTASNFDRIMTPKNRQASKSQDKYIAELLGDMTSLNPPYFTQTGRPINNSMEYGRNTEDEAVRYYEMNQGVTVTRVGMAITDDDRFSCSPDGLVDPEGVLEVKCPERHTHMLYLMKDVLPLEYMCQCHGALVVTGRKWLDFISYCTGAPALIKRVVPNDFTMALRVQLELFSSKFEAAKRKFKVGENRQEVELNQDQLTIFKEYVDRLARKPAMEEVNTWLPELPSMEYELKRKVWLLIANHAKHQEPVWHFDRGQLVFRLEESVNF